MLNDRDRSGTVMIAWAEARQQGSQCNHHSVPDLSWQHAVPSQESRYPSVL